MAVAIAGGPDAAKLPDALRAAVDPKGEVIHAGKDEFVKALALIKEGKLAEALADQGLLTP